jgi:hypothetical protein
MSDGEGEDDYVNSIRNLRKRLTAMLEEIDDIVFELQKSEPLYDKVFPVKRHLVKHLGMKTASLSQLLDKYIPIWKKGGKITRGGRRIHIGEEGKYMQIPVNSEVDVYVLCNHMLRMLDTKL